MNSQEQQLVTLKRLRDAMEQAKALYEGAKEQSQRFEKLNVDLPPGHADGSRAHVYRVETHLFELYRKAVMEYNHFLLGGHSAMPPRK